MLRLFLSRRADGTIFEPLPVAEDRELYLQRVFSQDIAFTHRRKNYVYKSYTQIEPPGVCMGVIGRPNTVKVGGPPEKGFPDVMVPDWETANLFIDPTAHKDGQKVALQDVKAVGLPLSVLKSLVNRINRSESNSEWQISVNAISEENEFWKVVKTYDGRISEIDLNFVTPNIWRGQTETENALRVIRNKNNADEVEIRLKNSQNMLRPNSEEVKDSVDYISRGGGSLKIKGAGRRTLYDSEKHVVSAEPERDGRIQDGDVRLLAQIIARLFGI